jgi:hypothetical protein
MPVVEIIEGQRVWGHAFCVCNLCLREWTAATCSAGPYECPSCHAMAGQALERWEGGPATLIEVLRRFPMEASSS